jgi:hypothetical protein
VDERRVVVTDNEDDFCRIVADELSRGRTHAGIIYTPGRRYSRHDSAIIGRMVNALVKLLDDDVDLSDQQHWLA